MWLVYCATYRSNSYGIRIFYQLVDLLLKSGRDVRIRLYDKDEEDYKSIMPLKYRSLMYEGPLGENDIVVYSEIIPDNPLNAKCVVRYLLTRPYYYAGQKIDYGLTDYLVAHSEWIDVSIPSLLLHVDERELLWPYYEKKSMACLYYGTSYNLELDESVKKFLARFDNVITITRQWPNDRNELFSLIRNAEVLVSMDPFSNLAIESTLCGTPCWIVNDLFDTKSIVENDKGPTDGLFYKAEDFEYAKTQVNNAYISYINHINNQSCLVSQFASNVENYFMVLSELLNNKSGIHINHVIDHILNQSRKYRTSLDWLQFARLAGGKKLESMAIEDLILFAHYRRLRKIIIKLLVKVKAKNMIKRVLRSNILRFKIEKILKVDLN